MLFTLTVVGLWVVGAKCSFWQDGRGKLPAAAPSPDNSWAKLDVGLMAVPGDKKGHFQLALSSFLTAKARFMLDFPVLLWSGASLSVFRSYSIFLFFIFLTVNVGTMASNSGIVDDAESSKNCTLERCLNVFRDASNDSEQFAALLLVSP